MKTSIKIIFKACFLFSFLVFSTSILQAKVTPGVSATPDNLNFGTVMVNVQSGTQCVTVTNTGNGALHYSVLIGGANPTEFQTSDLSGNIAVGKSVDLCLWFMPISIGIRQADLQVECTYNGTYDSILQFPLTGTGTAPGGIMLSPTSLQFGPTTIGMLSETKCFTFTNTGSQSQNLSGIVIRGTDSNLFKITSALPTSIPSQGTASICINFSPNIVGSYSAYLDLVYGTTGIHIQPSLKGDGIAPIIHLDPIGNVNTSTTMFVQTFVRLGQSTIQSLYVKNTGNGPLMIDAKNTFLADLMHEYSIIKLPQNPIASFQGDTIFIQYSPRAEGSNPAELYIVSNAINGMKEIDLSGTGILPRITGIPKIINFDTVTTGVPVCKTFNVSNPGSDTLWVSGYFTNNDGDFNLYGLSSQPSFILPGKAKDISLCVTSYHEGALHAQLTFKTNIPLTFESTPRDTGTMNVSIFGISVAPSHLLIKHPALPDTMFVGTEVILQDTIFNYGGTDALITSAETDLNIGMDIIFSGLSFPFIVPAKGYVVFSTDVISTGHGRDTALMRLYTADNKSAYFFLTTYGAITCNIADKASLFDNTIVVKYGSGTQSVTVTNCGDVPAIYAATITGTGYSVDDNTYVNQGPIAPGNKAIFNVVFHPEVTGMSNGNVLIQAPDLPDINIPLSAEGACAEMLSETPIIPTAAVGSSSSFYIVLGNNGNYAWTPGTPHMTPSDVFHVISMTPSVIPAYGSGLIMASFSPKALGLTSGQVTFPNAGPCEESPLTIDLAAESVVSSVADITSNGFALDQNYPNPVAGTTTFRYTIPKESKIRITLNDLSGKVISELINGKVSAGEHTVTFDASGFASGAYIYVLESGTTILSKSLVLSK